MNKDREALLASLTETHEAREQGVTYFASANACLGGVDMTVSWSDGEPGSPPSGAMLLALSWDALANLVLRYGRPLDEATLVDAAAAVLEKDDGEG